MMAQSDSKKMFYFWKLIFCLQLYFISTAALCNVCQQNQVACINSTSFYLCFGGNTPNMDVLYHCKEGFECTESNAICLQAIANRPPSCGATTLCGQCSAHRNSLFACLSRSTFQMCYGAIRPTGQIGYCPTGFVCDAGSDSICVSAAGQHTVTCDIIDPVTTIATTPTTAGTTNTPTRTPTTPTTTTPTFPMTPNEVCAQQTVSGLYPTMPHDPYCKRYIYCRKVNGVLSGIEATCPTNSYYDIEMEQCRMYKPANCI